MDDFLTKPLNEEGLRRALAQASLRKAGMALRLEAQPASTASTGGDVPTLNPSVLGVFRGLLVPSGPDPLAELVDLFLSDLPQRLAEISGAARAGDAAALKAAAHTLKGSANNLGGLRMAALCAQLEGAGTDAQRVTGLLRELSEEAERLRVALEAEKAL
jgi:HPt (histidine-containing phosphotransfer) domain-containing protein